VIIITIPLPFQKHTALDTYKDNCANSTASKYPCSNTLILIYSPPSPPVQPRSWHQHVGFRGLGRYLPDTSAPASDATDALQPIDAGSALATSAAEDGGGNGGGGNGGGGNGRPRRGDALEEWLRRMTTTNGANAEINVQFGQFSLRKQTLGPLPPMIRSSAEFASVFGDAAGAEPMQVPMHGRL